MMDLNFVVMISLLFSIRINPIVTDECCNKSLADEVIKTGRELDEFCLACATLINEARIRNESVSNVPESDMTERNVTFMLLPTINTGDVQNLTSYNRTALEHSSFDTKKLVMIIMPGLDSNGNVEAENNRPVLGSMNINLIIVDWSEYSSYNACYSLNVSVPKLGEICAKFVKLLMEYGTEPKQIMLQGSSAGGQAAGFCGKLIHPKIGAITAFDPAGPCFISQNDSHRLAKTDAEYVSIFHCSAVLGVPPDYSGNADYYLGCAGIYINDCVNEITPLNIGICSHGACFRYLNSTTINPNNLVGVKCNSQENFFNKTCSWFDREIVGYFSRRNVTGKIYAPIPFSLEPSYENGPTSWSRP